jgi:hypothetical protein
VLVPQDRGLGAGLGGAVSAHLTDYALARKLLLGRTSSTFSQCIGNGTAFDLCLVSDLHSIGALIHLRIANVNPYVDPALESLVATPRLPYSRSQFRCQI